MKITIDTKEDSHEEIRNIIKMLSSLVGGSSEPYSNQDIFSDISSASSTESSSSDSTASEAPAPTAGIFNMFGNDNAASSSTSASTPESSTVLSSEQSSSEEVSDVNALIDASTNTETSEIEIKPKEDTSEKETQKFPQFEEY